MSRKQNVDVRLMESFKELAKRIPIEKITIQEITDGAGVIRPTFYNHFQDKYQLLEHIFQTEIINPANPLIRNDMLNEAVVLIFINMLKDREFYGRVYRLEGQNSFESIVRSCVYDTLLSFIREHSQNRTTKHKLLSQETLAEYYSQFLSFIVITWMGGGMTASPQEMGEIFDYIKSHSLYEVIREME